MLMVVKTSCLRIHEGNCILDLEDLGVRSLARTLSYMAC